LREAYAEIRELEWALGRKTMEVEILRAAQEIIKKTRRCAENALEMLREGQAAALRAQMAWPEAFKDPMHWYQSVCPGEHGRRAQGVRRDQRDV